MTNEEVLNEILEKFNYKEAANIFHCYPNKSIDQEHTIRKIKKFTVVMFKEMMLNIETLRKSKSAIPYFMMLKRRNLVLLRIGNVYELWYSPIRFPNGCDDETDEDTEG